MDPTSHTSHKGRPSQHAEHSHTFSPSPAEPLRPNIEQFLGGNLLPRSFSDLAESHLINHQSRAGLVVAAHDLRKALEERGYAPYLQYCKCTQWGHPVPVITTLDEQGRFIIPNINALWNHPDPMERGNPGASPHTKKVITDEQSLTDGPCSRRPLVIETFSPEAPVSLILLPSQQVEAPAYAHTCCSPQAFREALSHAASSIINNERDMASFIRRDILEPHVRDFIRRSSQLFGEREIPEIIDWGTTHDGNTFYIGAFVPYYTHHQETKLVIHVAQMDGDYHVHELKTPPTSPL